MNLQIDRNTKVFNTPIEIGLRVLFILNKFHPKPLSLESLIYLDYFLIHSQDIKDGPPSLHPKYPFRSTEIIIKREIIQTGLKYLLSKELIQVQLSNNGIKYTITNLTSHVLILFESTYANKLQKLCDWLYKRFGDNDEDSLKTIVDTNIEKWGGEFIN